MASGLRLRHGTFIQLMTTADEESGRTLAEVRARTALRGAGLDPTRRARAGQQRHQRGVAHRHPLRPGQPAPQQPPLPRGAGGRGPPARGRLPQVVAHGGGRGEDWLVQERLPGRAARPRVADAHRRAARAGRRTGSPSGWPPSTAPRRRPTCPRSSDAPQLLEVGAADPPARRSPPSHEADEPRPRRSRALRRGRGPGEAAGPDDHPVRGGDPRPRRRHLRERAVARRRDHGAARRRVGPARTVATSTSTSSCAARPIPSCTWPRRSCRRPGRRTTPRCPGGSARPTPSLFEYPRQIDRVRIYSIAYDVRDLLAAPPTVAAAPPPRAPRLPPAGSGWCTARATSTSSGAAASRSPLASRSSSGRRLSRSSTGTTASARWWHGVVVRVDCDQVGVEALGVDPADAILVHPHGRCR